MHGLLDFAAGRFPDWICVEDDTLRLSYHEVQQLSVRIANGLHGAGLRPGDHASILSLNHPFAFAVPLGCMRAGVPPLPLNPMSAVDEVSALITRNDVRWLFFHSHFEPIVAQLRQVPTPLLGAVCLDRPAAGWPALAAWLASSSDRWSGDPLGASDIACLFSTGGTSGAPKGAQLRLRSLHAMVASFLACMPHQGRPVYLAATPISHGAAALAWSFMAHGVRTILLRRPEPEQMLSTIERERVSLTFLPPTAIYNLLACSSVGRYDLSSLQHFLYAAAPISTDRLQQAVETFGPVMCQSFGQAEAPIICTFFSREEHVDAVRSGARERLSSCGRPAPLTEVAVMDDDGQLLPAGMTGEIVVRGDLVMAGYYGNPEATAEASLHGWHHTGDLGYRDEEGFYYLVDRKRDMIITGGFNVYPTEIERRLLAHAAVLDCAVVGVPDLKWGEAVKAVVECRAGATVDATELIRFVRDGLGSLKAPKSVEFWPQLPRSSVGKVLRREVRARYWAGLDRKV